MNIKEARTLLRNTRIMYGPRPDQSKNALVEQLADAISFLLEEVTGSPVEDPRPGPVKVFNLPHATCPHCDFLRDIQICNKCGGWCTCEQTCDRCDKTFALDWSEL